MGEEIKEKTNWDEIFETQINVMEYLRKNNLLDKNWKSSRWLRENSYYVFYQQACMQRTIKYPEKRFKSWDLFLVWMGIKNKNDIKDRVDWNEIFKSPENAKSYLEENNLLDKNWKSSEWLATNGYRSFYVQAVSVTSKGKPSPRFRSWNDFLIWMGERESRNEENYQISEDVIKKIREVIEDEF